MTRDRNPLVESFGPELLAALLSAATGSLPPVRLPWNKAIRFRQRLYSLRSAMRKAKHDKYHLVCRVKITISWPQDIPSERTGEHRVPADKHTICDVTLSPNDSEFSTALKNAGLDTSLGIETTELLPPPSPKEKPSEMDILEALLNDIK